MASPAKRADTAQTRAVREEMVGYIDSRLAPRGFAFRMGERGSEEWIRRSDRCVLATERVSVPIAAVYGGLEMSCHATLQLDRDRLAGVAPEAARQWWLEFAGEPGPALIYSCGQRDLPGASPHPMVAVDLETPQGAVDEVVFPTLDSLFDPKVRELAQPEGLARFASTPQVFGRFHGVYVRSAIVELYLLGRGDLVPGVMAAFERGPQSRNDADHPESWAAFKEWVTSMSPEQWRELAA